MATKWQRDDRVLSQHWAMDPADRLLSIEELAGYLEVPVATIYGWRYRDIGPQGFRVGKHVRFRWADVERWIDGRLRDETLRSGSPRRE